MTPTSDTPWPLAERLAKAEIVAKGGGTIEDIRAMAHVSREQAVLIWVRTNSKDNGCGLSKHERIDAPWLIETLALLNTPHDGPKEGDA